MGYIIYLSHSHPIAIYACAIPWVVFHGIPIGMTFPWTSLGFRRLCPDFYGFCPDFHQIKTFGGALAPRLLHNWLAAYTVALLTCVLQQASVINGHSSYASDIEQQMPFHQAERENNRSLASGFFKKSLTLVSQPIKNPNFDFVEF